MQERRHAERFQINLKARWESLLASGRGTVSDLSATGCFLLTGRRLRTGELVRLAIEFPDDRVLTWGEIVYAVPEIGVALKFVFDRENERRAFEKMMAKCGVHAFDTASSLG